MVLDPKADVAFVVRQFMPSPREQNLDGARCSITARTRTRQVVSGDRPRQLGELGTPGIGGGTGGRRPVERRGAPRDAGPAGRRRVHVPLGQATPGEHTSAFRHNYLSPTGSGDHTRDSAGTAYTETTGATYVVSAVDVANPRLTGTIVAFGSSVVDGTGSTNCGPGCTELGTNRRWTDVLARRITTELPASRQHTVANAGIDGTTSSAACPGTPGPVAGLDALSRLDRDVLALHGVTAVLYYYGTNDLANACDARQILDSYRQVFARLHDAGIKVYVTPITPRPGYTDQNNLDRHAVGTFVKNGNDCAGTCDGVMDFDQVLKDPLEPNSILPAYDTGDGVHANIAGQEALAGYVSLSLITN